jgi:hypothetical protein
MPASPVPRGDVDKFDTPPPGAVAVNSEADIQEAFDTKLSAIKESLGAAPKATEEPAAMPAPEVIVSEEDKREYIRSLLNDQPFTKTYSLFGGAVTVQFRTRAVKENDVMRHELKQQWHRRGYMLVSANYVTIGKETTTRPGVISYLRGIDTADWLRGIDDIVYSALLRAFDDFERICDAMFKRANDANFWTGIAGAV